MGAITNNTVKNFNLCWREGDFGMALVSVFRCLFLFSHLLLLLSAVCGNGKHDECPKSFDCGKLGTIQFPFTKAERPDCGLLIVYGCDNPNPSSIKTIQLQKNGRLLELNGVVVQPQNFISVLDPSLHNELMNNTCLALNNNISSLPHDSPLVSFHIQYKVTMYRCNHSLNVMPPSDFIKHTCPGYDLYYDGSFLPSNDEQVQSSFSKCSVLQLPRKDLTDTKDLLSFLTAQMVIEVPLSDECDKCYNHMGGQCRLDRNRTFFCDKAVARAALAPTLAEHKRKVFNLGLGLALSIGVVVMLLFVACCFIRKPSSFLWTKKHPTHQIIETFFKEHGPLSTRRYTYDEIEKATNYFKHKLGQGGYGSVYKGKLQDGSLIAVKLLSELKGTGEEFINEVASISRTSHVNIVSLLGFCFQGSKRALVYEFMPNGSLEKFIYEDNTNMVDRQLDCKTLYDIAIGVARGLEYLHRGCNTRILHFDIKPHNILLDDDFCPKISDFGLAKVCSRKESIVSLLGARGTAGYIAPEVFSRSFGGVSHKSDVYSYGMMVLEMVGGRRNINVEVECSSEIYFPHWIYKRLELNQEVGLRCIKNDIDKERVRKMSVVSLWCIQTNPLMRPEMRKVVEMVEGSLESLQIPPKPYLSSPPTSPAHDSTQTCETL